MFRSLYVMFIFDGLLTLFILKKNSNIFITLKYEVYTAVISEQRISLMTLCMHVFVYMEPAVCVCICVCVCRGVNSNSWAIIWSSLWWTCCGQGCWLILLKNGSVPWRLTWRFAQQAHITVSFYQLSLAFCRVIRCTKLVVLPPHNPSLPSHTSTLLYHHS